MEKGSLVVEVIRVSFLTEMISKLILEDKWKRSKSELSRQSQTYRIKLGASHTIQDILNGSRYSSALWEAKEN